MSVKRWNAANRAKYFRHVDLDAAVNWMIYFSGGTLRENQRVHVRQMSNDVELVGMMELIADGWLKPTRKAAGEFFVTKQLVKLLKKRRAI